MNSIARETGPAGRECRTAAPRYDQSTNTLSVWDRPPFAFVLNSLLTLEFAIDGLWIRRLEVRILSLQQEGRPYFPFSVERTSGSS